MERKLLLPTGVQTEPRPIRVGHDGTIMIVGEGRGSVLAARMGWPRPFLVDILGKIAQQFKVVALIRPGLHAVIWGEQPDGRFLRPVVQAKGRNQSRVGWLDIAKRERGLRLGHSLAPNPSPGRRGEVGEAFELGHGHLRQFGSVGQNIDGARLRVDRGLIGIGDGNRLHEFALRGKHLHTVVAVVGDIDPPIKITGHPLGKAEVVGVIAGRVFLAKEDLGRLAQVIWQPVDDMVADLLAVAHHVAPRRTSIMVVFAMSSGG